MSDREKRLLVSEAVAKTAGIITETIGQNPDVEAIVIMVTKNLDNQETPSFDVATCPPNRSDEHLAHLLQSLLNEINRKNS